LVSVKNGYFWMHSHTFFISTASLDQPAQYHGPHELCIIAGGLPNQLILS